MEASGRQSYHAIKGKKIVPYLHPAAKKFIDFAQLQHDNCGDGSASMVLLAAAIFKEFRPHVLKGVDKNDIIGAVDQAEKECLKQIAKLAKLIPFLDGDKYRKTLVKCAATAMNSVLKADAKDVYSNKVVDAVLKLDESAKLNLIGIQQLSRGKLNDSTVVDGIAFKNTTSEKLEPKANENSKIAFLNIVLQLKAERDVNIAGAHIDIDNSTFVDEVKLFEILKKIHGSGANVVLSQSPIGNTAKQYFTNRGMFCADRVSEEDWKRTVEACGGTVLFSVDDLKSNVLGECGSIKNFKIAGEHFNILTGKQ